ncbi:MAG TPA: FtsX-like permease family protein [Polyangiales bacterium]|nr:FtsX-like permease family protein [Polyangiales bacterium]
MLKRMFRGLFGLVGNLVLALVALAAWSLGPWRMGRLLQAVSLPRLREHRLRTALSVLGVALGVAMLIAVIIVNGSVVRGVTATVQDLAGKTDLQISAGSGGFSEELIEQVRAAAGVARAVPSIQQTVTVRDPRARGERLMLLGVDMLGEDDAYFRDYDSAEVEEIRKDPLAFLNSTHNVLLSRSFAQRWGFKQRDSIALVTSEGVQDFTVWGFITDEGVGHAFGGAIGVMYYQAMQAAFGRGTNIDRIDIAIDSQHKLADVERSLSERLGPGFVVERPANKGERVGRLLSGVKSGLTVASLIALLVGAFLIHNTMAISVVQRKREIGILRALGTRRREIVALVTLEGALLGAVSSLVGIFLGALLSKLLLIATSDAVSRTYMEIGVSHVSISGRVFAIGSLVGTGAATVASAIPARRAAQQRTAETLRTANLVDVAGPKLGISARDIAGLLCLVGAWPFVTLPVIFGMHVGAITAAGVLLGGCALLLPRLVQGVEWSMRGVAARWFSVEARLASENLPRDVGRTSITAGALMSGVALVVGFGAFTHSFTTSLMSWIDQTLPGDLFITQSAASAGVSSRNMPLASGFYTKLAGIPEIESISRTRIIDVPFRGENIKLVARDLDVYQARARFVMLEGEHSAVVKRLHAGDAMVSENFSRRFGVHAGDEVELGMQTGTHRLRVAGVYVDYTSDVGTVLLGRERYVSLARDQRVDTFEVMLRDARDAPTVRRKIFASMSREHDLNVLTSGEFRAALMHTTDGIFGLVRALELVALIVAVLGVVNAQFANVLDRKRELAVLRALGMLRKQLTKLIVIEAALVGAVGTLAGILLGFMFAYLLLAHINLVQTGWHFPFRVSVRAILEVLVLTVPAAALAGLYPAFTAARAPVTEGLESE